MKLRNILLPAALLCTMAVSAQNVGNGGLSPEFLSRVRSSYQATPADRAIHNALNTADIKELAANKDARYNLDGDFAYRVPSKGITNQRSSGRCWLFTGLNVLRAQAMRQNDIPELEFSQVYNFFYDQLEKTNLFLQAVIETAKKPMDDRKVEWIFRHPMNDGGQFTGISDNISKYGVVPRTAMPETYVSEHTSTYRQQFSYKLKEWGLQLRKLVNSGAKPAAVQAAKDKMLEETYAILVRCFGVPPTTFKYEGKEYTPIEFYNKMLGNDLKNNYVMFMNDPTRPYYKVYEIDLDRHAWDGQNWTYLNVPMEDIKKMAMASIKDSVAMYFSCDVNKFLDRPGGTLDMENYDYGAILGTTLNMNKEERILTGASGSTHAMTLRGFDVDENGAPVKWLIENSWGNTGKNGYLYATDKWMDEYLFRLVVERRFVPQNLLDLMKQKPIMLPCWDPMF